MTNGLSIAQVKFGPVSLLLVKGRNCGYIDFGQCAPRVSMNS